MEYKVVCESSPQKLEKAVNDLIKMGWKPLGGVSFAGSDRVQMWNYIQAMVK